MDQDTEHCSVLLDGVWENIRFHDYARIFTIPGLYEKIFHDVLHCQSPDVIGKLFKEEIQRDNVPPASLRVLDLGAGNGMIGEQLRTVGVGHLTGVDIIPEARAAAFRDRPGVYDDYHVADLTEVSGHHAAALANARFNALSCVAALGYDDIPPAAFRSAFNFVSDGGWIAFTIKDRFLSDADTSGFARLIHRCREAGVLTVRNAQRYRHRLDTQGRPLHYVALVGTKERELPAELLS